MSDAASRLNAALEGRYAIESELGEGGMATVRVAQGADRHAVGAWGISSSDLLASRFQFDYAY